MTPRHHMPVGTIEQADAAPPRAPGASEASSASGWLILTLIWLLSFVSQHQFAFSPESSLVTSNELADVAAQGNPIRRVALILMGLVGLFCLMRYGLQRLRLSGLVGWTWLALSLWTIASLSWSPDPAFTARRLLVFACLMTCACGLAVAAFSRLPEFIAMFCALNLAVGVATDLAFGAFPSGFPESRFSGTVHPNLQGVNIALLVLACIAILLAGNRKSWLPIVGIIAALPLLILTQSRTSMAALGLTLIFTFCVKSLRSRGLWSLAAPVAVTIGFAGLFIVGVVFPASSLSELMSRVIVMERDVGGPASLTGRADLWRTVLEYSAERPLTGFGHDTFWSPRHILEISSIHQWSINQAHNAYLEILLNLGLVGLGLYVLLMGSAWVASMRRSLQGSPAFGLASSLLLFGGLHNALESINALPVFSNFWMSVVVFRLALLTDA